MAGGRVNSGRRRGANMSGNRTFDSPGPDAVYRAALENGTFRNPEVRRLRDPHLLSQGDLHRVRLDGPRLGDGVRQGRRLFDHNRPADAGEGAATTTSVSSIWRRGRGSSAGSWTRPPKRSGSAGRWKPSSANWTRRRSSCSVWRRPADGAHAAGRLGRCRARPHRVRRPARTLPSGGDGGGRPRGALRRRPDRQGCRRAVRLQFREPVPGAPVGGVSGDRPGGSRQHQYRRLDFRQPCPGGCHGAGDRPLQCGADRLRLDGAVGRARRTGAGTAGPGALRRRLPPPQSHRVLCHGGGAPHARIRHHAGTAFLGRRLGPGLGGEEPPAPRCGSRSPPRTWPMPG